MITISAETSKDISAIRHVVEMAFGQTSEPRLVEALRQADACCPFDLPDEAFMAAELFPGAGGTQWTGQIPP